VKGEYNEAETTKLAKTHQTSSTKDCPIKALIILFEENRDFTTPKETIHILIANHVNSIDCHKKKEAWYVYINDRY